MGETTKKPRTHADKDLEIAALKQEIADNAQVKPETTETAEAIATELETVKGELKMTQESEARLFQEISNMENQDINIVNGKVVGSHIRVMTPDEYRTYSAEQGLIMGRHPKQVTNCSIEELRALINSKWTPKMVMEKHGMDAEGLKQLIWKLSKRELRDNPIKYSIERDFFAREG